MSGDTLAIKRNRQSSAIVTQTKTRPADTSAYATGDVLAESTSAGTVWTFANVVREAGKGAIITGAELIIAAAPATKPEGELYLFDTSITTQNDNVAWAPTSSDLAKCLGMIDFGSTLFRTGSSNGVVSREGLATHIITTAALKDIYGIMVIRNSYTPTSAEVWTVRLKLLQD